MLEINTVYCGDCAQVMQDHIPDESIDLTVTSPPYDVMDEDYNLIPTLRDYNGYSLNFADLVGQLWRVTKEGGVVVWVVGDATVDGSETMTSFKQALYFRELGFNLHDTMIYERYGPPSVDIIQNRYYQSFEFMYIFSKGKPSICNHLKETKQWEDNRKQKQAQRMANGNFTTRKVYKTDGKIKGNIWRYSIGGGHTASDNLAVSHPATFPEALARDHIISWSNPGDVVLDPMCGSGTTLKMAKELGRQWIGIDISQEYVDLAKRRVDGARVPLPGMIPEPEAKLEQLNLMGHLETRVKFEGDKAL